MSQRLIQPGLSAAGLIGKYHPLTGELIVPLGYTSRGPIWPAIGGAPEDDDDPDDDPDDDDSDDDDDDSSDDDKDKSKKSKKSGKDDDDDDDDKPRYTEAEYKKLKDRMKAADRRADEAMTRIKALENKDKKPEDVASAELTEANTKLEQQATANKELRLQVAFLSANQIKWHDPEDALAMADLSGVDVDDSGTVDTKALRAALKDLAKRKPHLVDKSSSKKDKDDDDDKDDKGRQDDQGSSGSSMNGRRKGESKTPDRKALAARFPVLGGR